LVDLSRPFGTSLSSVLVPTLKRWAILMMSLRDKAPVNFRKALAPARIFPSAAKPQPKLFSKKEEVDREWYELPGRERRRAGSAGFQACCVADFQVGRLSPSSGARRVWKPAIQSRFGIGTLQTACETSAPGSAGQ
jgi:hypothetical protein